MRLIIILDVSLTLAVMFTLFQSIVVKRKKAKNAEVQKPTRVKFPFAKVLFRVWFEDDDENL